MDDEEGLLRVATTIQGAANNLFVLEADGERLEIVGAVTEIAPGERIMSARFLEDRAYVVTFRRVDPLFTIDLTNPREPELVGELKVPGFSTYLHPLDEGLLIGVGRDADPVTGRATSVQVSLFDVARMEKPVRLDVDVLIEGSWANSVLTAALYDHHAFAYFADERVLALPVHWKERVGSESEDRFETKLWRVDGGEGLKEIATIGHESAVARNVMIGGFVYLIAADGVKVVDLRRAGAVVGEMGFARDS
jgi:uncharacterized secreted protein with C-terminal beta-propeller domain